MLVLLKCFTFSLCLLLSVYTYETDLEHDIMKCYDKSKSNPQTPEDCTNLQFKNALYSCCYLQKTPKPVEVEGEDANGNRDLSQKKSCLRLLYDKDTIHDVTNKLKNDYTDLSLICSSLTIKVLYISFAILLLLL